MRTPAKEIRTRSDHSHDFITSVLAQLSIIHDMAELSAYVIRQFVTVQPKDLSFVAAPVEPIRPTTIAAFGKIEVGAIIHN
jgi:hypothetical protein